MKAARRIAREPVSIGDADLVTRARAGDRWAEDTLFRRYGKQVAGLVARLLGSVQDADDVVHDAFVSALEQLPKLRDPSAFRGWLMQIAVMRVRQALRKKRLLRALGLLPSSGATLDAVVSSDLGPEARAELAVIDAALHSLPANQRIAWMLRHVEGYQLAEVAELADCSLAATKRRIRAAQDAIDAVLADRRPG